ncbi:uncharacterized protein FOMMEDRAFT_163266 [Fomitiporia mediterranea MF3/22]|uniref:Sld7 C-terminal domain-containing protein n=1 Tax=Fomitiporia mediterranea (strain MF3/22) TaxID=694068 RepID=R7SFF3_FOMME|nr:uncharacterized protein FOMMEDRAFT_163266 [Fomitiporia mediterranea MF3/22]EJC97456.1 hypothetical protein FOMMEDRAFT_163266 [Fomitiporia mediterranea MF3/22]
MTTALLQSSRSNAHSFNAHASVLSQDRTQTPVLDATSSSFYSFQSTTQSATQPRLLYRGSLSLPHSHLLLDGLTFTIALPSDDPSSSRTLLETPLPLALESMRGRPSLRFSGVVKMEDICWEDGERVNLHVHPRCILTRQLFEQTLCSTPVSSTKGHTDSGIRISLGDTSNANANNDIAVFGCPHPSSSIMQLCVARILPTLPKPTLLGRLPSDKLQQMRPPRPDDPTPRKPPAGFAGIARVGLGMKRTASMKFKDIEKEKGDNNGTEVDSNNRMTKDKESTGSKEGTFKIPALPPGKARQVIDVDIFDAPMDVEEVPKRASDLETRNKTFIKKATVRLMSAAGISKINPSFKDFFNQVYHGTSFALRSKLSVSNFDSDSKEAELVDRVVQAHITLYLGGLGVGVLLLQQQ